MVEIVYATGSTDCFSTIDQGGLLERAQIVLLTPSMNEGNYSTFLKQGKAKCKKCMGTGKKTICSTGQWCSKPMCKVCYDAPTSRPRLSTGKQSNDLGICRTSSPHPRPVTAHLVQPPCPCKAGTNPEPPAVTSAAEPSLFFQVGQRKGNRTRSWDFRKRRCSQDK